VAKTAQILYRLQSVDLELADLNNRLREAESLLGESTELKAARLALQKVSSKHEAVQAQLRSLELDLKTVNARIASTAERLYGGQVSNPKELASLEQDLTNSKNAASALESRILESMEQLDSTGQDATAAQNGLQDAEQACQVLQARAHDQIDRLREQITALTERRGTLAGTVQSSELAVYEQLRRSKGGRAVAILEGVMCQGCRMTIPSGKAQLVRQSDQIVTCMNCGRILTPQP